MSPIVNIAQLIVKKLVYSWFCDKCDEVTVREEQKRGTNLRAEDTWPTHTPTSKRCPDCGNWAGFISANLKTIPNEELTKDNPQ